MTERLARAVPKSTTVTPCSSGVLQRKCACGAHTSGGQCSRCKRDSVHRKALTVAPANDPLEIEADRVARQVMSGSKPSAGTSATARIQRMATHSNTPTGAMPVSVERTLASAGRPLDPALRQDMEQRFGHDFSHVRIHTDTAAEQSASDMDARAYTVGHDVVFGPRQFAPASTEGSHLLAHELTHVVQQSALHGTPAPLMRKSFESSIKICRRVLESRKFEVTRGGVRVVIAAQKADSNVPDCGDFNFIVSLSRERSWWQDKEIGTCAGRTGSIREFRFAGLATGTYYLTFARVFDNPYCCLEGEVLVFDEAQSADGAGCTRATEMSTIDIVHEALNLAGLIPALGAVPDGINAGIYAVQGDWVNAGLSAAATLPVVGDGLILSKIAGKAAIKVEAKTAIELGSEGLAKELKQLKAASQPERSALQAAERTAADADAKALDEAFRGGNGEGAYSTTRRLKAGNLGERLAADALATDGHTVLHYKPDIRGTNQRGIDIVTLKDDVVYFVDNKALTTGRNVSDVSALTVNFSKNKASVIKDLETALKNSAAGPGERDVLQRALDAINSNRFKRVVTNASLTRDTAITRGVTDNLRRQGIEFIDVF